MTEHKWVYGDGYFCEEDGKVGTRTLSDPLRLKWLQTQRDFGYVVGRSAPYAGNDDQIAYNFIPFLRPESMLPKLSEQGAGTDQLVGNKFLWKNTLIRLELVPKIQRFYRALAPDSKEVMRDSRRVQNYTQVYPATLADEITGKSHLQTRDLNDNVVSGADRSLYVQAFQGGNDIYMHIPGASVDGQTQLKGCVIPEHIPDTAVESFVANPGTLRSGVVLTPGYNAPMTENASNGITDYQLPATGTTMEDKGTTYVNLFPLYRHPQARLYFYCRVMIFKMTMSYTDWNSFSNFDSYASFLNALWWRRDNGTTKSFSIRDPDLAIPNPFAKTFRIVYNKLLRINPFKSYNIDINLVTKRPNRVTIKQSGPYTTEGNYDLYENASYIGFILPPFNLDQDFDESTASMIYYSATYDPLGNGTVTNLDNEPHFANDEDPYEKPYGTNLYTLGEVQRRPGLSLGLLDARVRTRTCFID